MKIVSVECPRCRRLNQIPGSDIEILDLPGGSFRSCFSCYASLDFSCARVEDYQQSAAVEPPRCTVMAMPPEIGGQPTRP